MSLVKVFPKPGSRCERICHLVEELVSHQEAAPALFLSEEEELTLVQGLFASQIPV
jgi:hypothetical protein